MCSTKQQIIVTGLVKQIQKNRITQILKSGIARVR